MGRQWACAEFSNSIEDDSFLAILAIFLDKLARKWVFNR